MLSTFVYLRTVLTGLSDGLPRLSDERGQTAAEYLGILILVSAVIAAIFTLGVADDIADAVEKQIQDILGEDT